MGGGYLLIIVVVSILVSPWVDSSKQCSKIFNIVRSTAGTLRKLVLLFFSNNKTGHIIRSTNNGNYHAFSTEIDETSEAVQVIARTIGIKRASFEAFLESWRRWSI